jgi:hypothetical protein
MRIYLLQRAAGLIGYDEVRGFVIRASTQDEARQIAARESGDEGTATWLDAAQPCVQIGVATTDDRAGLVLKDFLHG